MEEFDQKSSDWSHPTHDPNDKQTMRAKYRNYMIECGIPSRFLRDDMTMRNYGKQGVFFADLFSDTKKATAYLNETPVLNIYGQSSEEIMYGLARVLLLAKYTVKVITPNEIFDLQKWEREALLDTQVLAIPYFYISDYSKCPFESELYTIESFLRRFIKQSNHILLLHSTHPLESLGWYGTNTVTDLKKYGRDINNDAGN